MTFVGQRHIIRQLDLYLPKIREGDKFNFLLIAPSGQGKTTLGFKMCNYLTKKSDKKYGYYLPNASGEVRLNKSCWVHFVDEVHMLKNPELLYPLLDSKEYIFIFASNMTGGLAEPLVNRCISLMFAPYNHEDLMGIISSIVKVPTETMLEIIKTSGGNPRILKSICQRFKLYLSALPDGSYEDFSKNFLGVKDGLDTMCQRYVEILKVVGGRASLDTLATMLHLDKDTIRYQIEPVLLYNKIITISSRGRSL